MTALVAEVAVVAEMMMGMVEDLRDVEVVAEEVVEEAVEEEVEEAVAGLLFPQLLLLCQSRAVLVHLSGQLTWTSSRATLATRRERERRLEDSLMSQCPTGH